MGVGLRASLVVAGSVEAFNSAVLAPIAAAVAAVTGVGEGQVEVTASAASVLLTVTISGFETKADAAASLPKFAQALNSSEHASLLLGVRVLAVSTAPARVALILPTPPTPPSPPPDPPPLDAGLVVGGVLGGACFVGLLAGLYYAWRWYERRLEIAMGIQPKPKPPKPKPMAPRRGPSKAKAVRRKLQGKAPLPSPLAARFGSRCIPTALTRAGDDPGSRPRALFKAPESLRGGGGAAVKAPRGDTPATKMSRGAAGSSPKNARDARRSERYQDRVP